AIPKGAKHVEEAWEFIKWMSSVECWLLMAEAEYKYARSWGRIYVPQMSANRKVNEAVFERFAPKQKRFRDAFKLCVDMLPQTKFRPVTPVGQLLWDEHVRAMEVATHHSETHKTPQQALDEGTRKVQEQLDIIYGNKTYAPLNWPVAVAVTLAAMALLAGGGFYFARGRLRGQMASGRAEHAAGYLFASPWLVGFTIVTAGPIVASIILSFCRYDVLQPPQFVGLANYRDMLFHDPLFWKSLGNTWYMVLGVPLGMVVGLGVAMLLNTNVRGLSGYRTAYYLPAIVPTVASSILWMWVLNPQYGLINVGIKGAFGAAGPNWLTDPAWAKPSIILMGLWAAGQGMIIWLAGLKGIPRQLYEAAEIDGAGPFRQFLHVTLPMLSPYIFFNLIMGIIGTFQIFNQAYIMTQGGPVDSTLFYVYYLFNNGFRYFQMGYASALAWALFLLILALTLVQLRLAPKWVHYG
ncbi:MAG: ABC transporter permease subunit, partial [Armatimonadota bacterium]